MSYFRLRQIRFHLLWLLLLTGLGPAIAQTPIARPIRTAPVQPPAEAAHPVALPTSNIALPVSGAAQSGAQTGQVVGTATSFQLQLQNIALAAQNASLTSQKAILMGQNAAETGQITTQNAQIAALIAKLAAAPSPTDFGQPYANPFTDDTHLVFALCEMSPLHGNGSDAIITAGYLKEVQEAAAVGIDGFALDTFNADSYLGLDADMIAAIDQYNAARTVGGSIPGNGHGVSRFYWMFCPDYINGAYEVDPIRTTFANFVIAHAADPSCAHYHGRPVMTCYAGDGGGASAVAANYPPLLAKIRAADVPISYWPGWGGDGGSTVPQELTAVGAEGGWAFPPKDTPLGATSPLAGIEALGASVRSTKTAAGVPLLWMQPIIPGGAYDGGLPAGSYWNDYGGSRSMAAQFASANTIQRPTWLMLLTWDDWGEGTGITAAASAAWQPGNWGFFGANYIGNVPGFFQPTEGLKTDLAYCIQQYKTSQPPAINSDTVVEYNRTETAAASLANGPVYFQNILGEPAGLPDPLDVTVYAKATGTLELSGVGPVQTEFVSAGVNRLRFSGVQAGLPFLQLKRGGQVILQLTGHAIASTATITPSGQTTAIPNLSIFSAVSSPGIVFTLKVPVPTPAFAVDHAGVYSRSSNLTNDAMGLCNIAAYDLSTQAPTLFAQNTLNTPASLGKTLDQIALPGMDPLSQYDLGYGIGGITLKANPLGGSQPPVGFPATQNSNLIFDFAGKPLPSGHVSIQCRVISTSADPNADGRGGVALVQRSNANPYFGIAYKAYVEKYAGDFSLNITANNNVSLDSNMGPVSLGSMGVNSLAPGEWYDVALTYDGVNLVATARPSNQHL